MAILPKTSKPYTCLSESSVWNQSGNFLLIFLKTSSIRTIGIRIHRNWWIEFSAIKSVIKMGLVSLICGVVQNAVLNRLIDPF